MNHNSDRISIPAVTGSQIIMAQDVMAQKAKVFQGLIRIGMISKEEIPDRMIATPITEIQIILKTGITTEINLRDTKNTAAEVHKTKTATRTITTKTEAVPTETKVLATESRIRIIITKSFIRLCLQPVFLYNLIQLLHIKKVMT
ncbi:MAG: hypothetical protein ABS44_07780 [Chryseobacterium sp. SCN 40-13]|nr:MAG: hypothetical protein ABS44_07780 [Chryseobacterium sp. SCN 40-13]